VVLRGLASSPDSGPAFGLAMVDSTAGAGILGNSQELFLPSTATHMMAVATYESPRMTNARLVPVIVAVALLMDNKGDGA
jgi:hypothetical protein